MFKVIKYILKIKIYYLHILTVILIYFVNFQDSTISNKMDSYNYNTKTLFEYLLEVKKLKSHEYFIITFGLETIILVSLIKKMECAEPQVTS